MRIIFLALFFINSQLFANSDEFEINLKLNYHNTTLEKQISDKKYLSPINHNLSSRFQLSADLNDETGFNIIINPQSSLESNTYCRNYQYINEANLSYVVNDLFSFDLGCLIQKRGGYEPIESSSMSYYNTNHLNLIYDFMELFKYVPAVNLNIDFIGTLTLQVMQYEDLLKKVPLSLNIAWTISLLGIEPLFQIGLYNELKSVHYSLGLKADLDQILVRGSYFHDKNEDTESDITKEITSWNIYTSYEYLSWVQPFFRVHHIFNKISDKLEQKFTTYSFGNKMEFYDEVEPYLSLNLIRDKEHKNHLEFRLGVNATI